MIKPIKLSVLCTLALCVSACENITDTNYYNVEGIGFKESQNGAWGILDLETGKPIYIDEFRNQPSLVVNGFFWTKESSDTSIMNNYTLYKVDDNSPKYIADNLLGVGYFSDGLIPTVTKDSRIALLNKNGDVAFSLNPYNEKEITHCGLRYMSGFLSVKCDGLWGAINTKGEMIIKPELEYIGDFLGDRCVALKKIENNGFTEYKWCIIDSEGKTINDFDIDIESKYPNISDGIWMLKYCDGYYFVELKSGSVICTVTLDENIKSFNSKYYVSEKDGQMRVCNYDKERIVRGDYSNIVLFNDDMFYAQKSKDKGYWINTDGERIETLNGWNNMRYNLRANTRTVEIDGSKVLLSDKGEIISEEYNSIESASDRYNNFMLASDYFNAEEVLFKLLEPFNFKTGSCYDITLDMTTQEVSNKYSDNMNRTNSNNFNLSDNLTVFFNKSYKVARYVTKTREGYWGPETYQEQDGYEWTDATVLGIILKYTEFSDRSYRLREIFAEFCEHIQEQGFSHSGDYGEYDKRFENDKLRISIGLEYLDNRYHYPKMQIVLTKKD